MASCPAEKLGRLSSNRAAAGLGRVHERTLPPFLEAFLRKTVSTPPLCGTGQAGLGGVSAGFKDVRPVVDIGGEFLAAYGAGASSGREPMKMIGLGLQGQAVHY